VRMRSRNPCVRARRRLFGWKVRLPLLTTASPDLDVPGGTGPPSGLVCPPAGHAECRHTKMPTASGRPYESTHTPGPGGSHPPIGHPVVRPDRGSPIMEASRGSYLWSGARLVSVSAPALAHTSPVIQPRGHAPPLTGVAALTGVGCTRGRGRWESRRTLVHSCGQLCGYPLRGVTTGAGVVLDRVSE
jgi:hypothetical protein